MLDYTVNGRLAERPGNRHPTMAPHGVFPTAGDDRWIAIACENDDQWRALCGVAGLAGELTELGADGRKQREDEIEAAIAEWTAGQDGEPLQALLQDAGIAAHRMQNSRDLSEDPQLIHRAHFVAGEHAGHGTIHVEGSRFTMSRTPPVVTQAGPTLGQHTFDVLLGVLGYDDERLSELVVAGVLE